MKQFTSHLDFSLTRKRLLMMSKSISRARYNSIMMVLAPLILAFSFMFYTRAFNTEGYKPVEFKSAIDGIAYKTDTILYAGEEKEEPVYPYHFMPSIKYDEHGQLFTGTTTFYNRMTREAGWEEHYTDGILTKTIYLSPKLIEASKVTYISYEYENGMYVRETRYDSNDHIITQTEHTETGKRRYNGEGLLVGLGYAEFKEGTKWIYGKNWWPNGQLMMESHSYEDANGLQSLRILYDEEGNETNRYRVKDGQMVESFASSQDS